MTYEEAVNWLFEHLPMYQRIGSAAYKKDIFNTIKLCNHLDNPQQHYPCIHIAGTNGKGSSSHMLASVLQEAGYKVGLYTSPHLKSFTERIKINGNEISRDYVADFVTNHKSFFEEIEPSFFEMTVGLAFNYFYDEKVDVAVIETGLGGRLDSTNIITPIESIITNIGLDHQYLLGDTVAEIAKEKAGIIKFKVPVIIGESNSETNKIFVERASELKSPIYFADKNWTVESFHITDTYNRKVKIKSTAITLEFESGLAGDYQLNNFITVAEALIRLMDLGIFSINSNHIEQGLSNVTKTTGLKGRWQRLGNNPTIIADTGHNVHGLVKVVDQLTTTCKGKLRMVIGFVNDKKLDDVLQILPRNAIYYFTQANIPRAVDAHELEQQATNYQLSGKSFRSVQDAVKQAVADSAKEDLVFIGGSTFVVAEAV